MRDKITNILTIVIMVVLLCLLGTGLKSCKASMTKEPTENEIRERLVSRFELAEDSSSFGRRTFRTYEAIVNKVMEEFEELEFHSLEKESLEVEGITSGVVAEYYEGYYVVITNELCPKAEAYSGPAAMLFTTIPPKNVQ